MAAPLVGCLEERYLLRLTLNKNFIITCPKFVQELIDGYIGSGFFIDKIHKMTVPTVRDKISIDKKSLMSASNGAFLTPA